MLWFWTFALTSLIGRTTLGEVPAVTHAGRIELESTSDEGEKGDLDSLDPAISGDGRVVAFYSFATNLDPQDRDSIPDIYVKDLRTGNIVLASIAKSGAKSDGPSYEVSISRDGSLVGFSSSATNLHPNDLDSTSDVYMKALSHGAVRLVSTSAQGAKGNDGSYGPSLAANGSRVAFHSIATNLHPRDKDDISDVFVKNLKTGELMLASNSDSGGKGRGYSYSPALSGDGTIVVFHSFATNLDPADGDELADVYAKNLRTRDLILVSTSDLGQKGNGDSYLPSVSRDGMLVAFHSTATNLDPSDSDPGEDVYVKDLSTGAISLISTSDTGLKGNGYSYEPAISADGHRVAFYSSATNLDRGDRDKTYDLYVKNLITGDISLMSTSDEDVKGNGASLLPSLSDDGSRIVFWSVATNLDPGDQDQLPDVYVRRSE